MTANSEFQIAKPEWRKSSASFVSIRAATVRKRGPRIDEPHPNTRRSHRRDHAKRFAARSLLGVVFVFTTAAASLADEAPRDRIFQGNTEYEAGRFRDALEAYAGIDDTADEAILPELLNNRAAAHYKLGAYEDARELWVRAAGLRDAAFEARARYNIGNCDYSEALRATQPPEAPDPGQQAGEPASVDVTGALDKLDHAIEGYRDALRLDPSLVDARANLELAAQLKKQIEEQAQQNQQSQPSSDQSQDQQDQNQQDQDQQDQQSQQNDQSDQQQDQSDQQNNQQDQSDQQDQPQQGDDDQQQNDEPQQGEDQQQQQPQNQPPQPEQADQQPQQELNMSPQEAQRLLQLIRDLEKQRREYLRRIEAGKQRPVDKDW